MTQQELFVLLESSGFPVAYHHFIVDEENPSPQPPYIIYLAAYSSNFAADNKVYFKSNNYQVELYTDKKDLESETAMENLLDGASIYWEKTEAYIDSEQLYQVIYEINI